MGFVVSHGKMGKRRSKGFGRFTLGLAIVLAWNRDSHSELASKGTFEAFGLRLLLKNHHNSPVH